MTSANFLKRGIKTIPQRALAVYILLVVIFRLSVDFDRAALERSHYLLGIFYNGSYKNYNDGIVYFEHLTRMEPNRAVHFASLGECYFQLGRLEKARFYFQKAISLMKYYETLLMKYYY